MHPFRNLLLISVGRADSLEKVLTPGEWGRMFQMARHQSLLAIIYEAVLRLPEHQRPPQEMMDKWKEYTDLTAGIYNRHQKHIEQLKLILDKMGHKSIIKAFDEAGYPPYEILYQEAKVDIFDDTEVEIHFHPCKMNNPFKNARLQKFFNSNAPFQGTLTYPDARFNAVFCMAHMYRHYLVGGIGMRQMLDYYYVLRELKPEDRAQVLDTLSKLGMKKFTAAVMCSMQFNFGLEDEYLLCPPDKKYGGRLVNDIINMGNFGMLDKRNYSAEGESRWKRFLRKNRRIFSNFRYFPGEVTWSPFARVSQHVWRLFNNYL